jgi:hypothetical protein
LLIPTTDGPRTWHCLRRSLIRQFVAAVRDIADDPEPVEFLGTRDRAAL